MLALFMFAIQSLQQKRKIGDLEREAADQQQKYQACYQQLVQQETEVAKWKEENEKQIERTQENNKELNK